MGLRSLILNPKSSHIIHKNYKLAPPSPPPPSQSTTTLSSSTRSLLNGGPPSWTSAQMDDVLGTDSGVGFMATSIDEMFMAAGTTRVYNPKRKTTPRSERVKREFPPPIPFLAQTGNRPCRMPWNLTRDYSNGKLVLRGEKAEYHEYFKAERENGRLVLKLVPLDNTITTCDDDDDNVNMNVAEVDEEHNEELEMGDVQFADEEEDDTAVDAEVGYDDENNDDKDDDDDNIDEWDSNAVDETYETDESTPVMAIPCNSVPQSHMEISRCAEKYGDLPKYFINGFNEAGGIHEHPRNYFGHPASAPLFVQ